jgi:hypothetical protein
VTVFDHSGSLYARSGEDGIAVLENLPPMSRIRPTVQCGDEWQGWAFVDIRPPDPVRPDGGDVTLVVARAARITGVVRDEAGDPVQGALVSGWSNTADTTRADGTFRLAVPKGREVNVAARLNPPDPCLRAEAKGVMAPAEGITLQFRRIPKTGTLSIRILDASGLPVPRLDLTVYAGEQRAVRTDDAGRTVLDGLPAAETRVFAWIPPRGPDDPWPLPGGGALPAPTTSTPDGREVEIRLVPGSDIRGTVVDAEGKPVPGAKVHARNGEAWMSVPGTTDNRGRFRVVVPAGEGLLTVRAAALTADGKRRAAENNDVRPGTNDLVLAIEEDAF